MSSNRPVLRILGIAACLVALSGCATVKGWFGGKSNAEAKPASLVQITPTVNVDRIWSANLGGGELRVCRVIGAGRARSQVRDVPR